MKTSETNLTTWRQLLTLGCTLWTFAACDGESGPRGPTSLVAIGADPRPAGALVTGLTIRALDDDGRAVGGAVLDVALLRGGGSLESATVVTNTDGEAKIDGWRLGVVPVLNRLEVSSAEVSLLVDLDAVVDPTLGSTLSPTLFGDLNGFLEAHAVEGSTEDLAFTPDGRGLVVGMAGGLATLGDDGQVTAWDLSGDTINKPLGIAFHPDGDLWVCDYGAQALLKVSAEGVVSTVLSAERGDELVQPNYVAVGADGALYLSDPCLGRLSRIDPRTGTVTAHLDFDLASEGGPNGIAIDADGALYVTTENTVLLCGHGDLGIELTQPIAGLFRTTFDGTAFTPKTAVAPNVGLFGDGAAFDREGNLYAIFDTADGLALDESIVFVLPRGETTLRRFFAMSDRILANLAFGRGAFGETTLYATLLAFVPFVAADARGVVRFEIGIGGAL